MRLCETLQQRWQACRARVYGAPPEPEDCADSYCGQWLGDWFGDRPCTSPRRSQCRAGGKPQKPDPWNPSHGWFQMPVLGLRP